MTTSEGKFGFFLRETRCNTVTVESSGHQPRLIQGCLLIPVLISIKGGRRADGHYCLMKNAPFKLFALQASTEIGAAIAGHLKQTLASHEEREFEDGEHKARPLENVSGADVYVVQSLHSGPQQSANDKFCRLAFFVGALKDAGAARVTAVVPYLCYARKDRRTKPHDPVTTRYVASMLESVGTDCVVTMEVHNPAAFENAFRIRTVALTATPLFVEYLKQKHGAGKLAIVSPDAGGMKRAELLREALEAVFSRPIGKGIAEKYRSAGVVSGDLFAGDVAGATAVIVDDLISTGGTLLRTAHSLRKAGAAHVVALVTHGLFIEGAAAMLADPTIEQIILTDTVPPFRLKEAAHGKLVTLSSVSLFAETIRRLHDARDLSELMAF